jgi:hypothetical protein
MKASSMVLSSFDLDYSGETLDPGILDRMMVAPGIVPLWESFLEQTSAGDGVAPGETPDLGLPDQTMATHDAALPAGGIVFGVDLG